MNSTGEAEWLAREALSALPAQLTSLPAALAVIFISIGCLWLRSGADDFSRLPGPAGSWLLGCLKQVGN